MIETIVLGLISTIVGLWLGSLEMRIKTLDARLREAPSRNEVSAEIEIRLESVKVLQKEIKEDIRKMEAKIDHILELQRGRNS